MKRTFCKCVLKTFKRFPPPQTATHTTHPHKNMEKSTPLTHLRRGPDEQEPQYEPHDGGDPRGGDPRDGGFDPRSMDPRAAEMMDHIVDDIEAGEGGGMQQRMPQPPPPRHDTRSGPHPGVIYRGQQRMMDVSMRGGGAGRGEVELLENLPFSQKLMHEAKEPLLVAVLVVILSSGQVHSLINRFLPMAQGNPLISLIVRAAIAGFAFYLLRRFIPT